jgi:type I restriction enzyme M protein
MPLNKYCDSSVLTNEAAVEQFFVARLIDDLGYRDDQVQPKRSLEQLVVSLGSRRSKYRPDYAFVVNGKVRWILDAKAPSENLDAHVEQCSGYCLGLNRRYTDENPVRYFVVTNGFLTRVYEWDRGEPILELGFADFQPDRSLYGEFLGTLSEWVFSMPEKALPTRVDSHVLRKRSISEINAAFSWCHQFIYRKDNLSQSAAFVEFVKLIFLKLLSDREVHANHPEFRDAREIHLDPVEVRFSVRWIEAREKDHPNPMDALQFQNLLQRLETEIQEGRRKRIFDATERINLTPETIKGVVARLEHVDLYSIDADINGRLFETFLNATMRGKDLGQFFTPRSVVKLATELARLRADREHVDKVIDACCGTGGFLIEALADMWDKVKRNRSLSAGERTELQKRIANESIYGIDVARDPALARIARMNMYLHGDGGAAIYQVDALDKRLPDLPTDSPEVRRERSELRRLLAKGGPFDIVLTNPPFAKEYQRRYPRDREVLEEYETAQTSGGDVKASLRSSVMFIERYHDLLRPGGRMIAIVDDSILGGRSYSGVRDFIRRRFLVRGVVSLPGDAFQRSKARVKTSLIILEKKSDVKDTQPDVFMYYCTAVGLDDSPRQRSLPTDVEDRRRAEEEIAAVSDTYASFLVGDPASRRWTVPATAIADRLDVKSCLVDPYRNISRWQIEGFNVVKLSQWIDVIYPSDEDDHENVLDTADSEEIVTLLSVRYAGIADEGAEIQASESTYSKLFRVSEGDIVVSNINAVHGAVAVVPPGLAGCYVTTEYTVCRAKHGISPRVVWALLRSPEARASLLLLSTGIGRSRVNAESILSLQLPAPSPESASAVAATLEEAEELKKRAEGLRNLAIRDFEETLHVRSDEADAILSAFKPPR